MEPLEEPVRAVDGSRSPRRRERLRETERVQEPRRPPGWRREAREALKGPSASRHPSGGARWAQELIQDFKVIHYT